MAFPAAVLDCFAALAMAAGRAVATGSDVHDFKGRIDKQKSVSRKTKGDAVPTASPFAEAGSLRMRVGPAA